MCTLPSLLSVFIPPFSLSSLPLFSLLLFPLLRSLSSYCPPLFLCPPSLLPSASSPFSPSQEDSRSIVHKQGFLVKQGGRVKSWRKRLFVLGSEGLAYFKTETVSRQTQAHNLCITPTCMYTFCFRVHRHVHVCFYPDLPPVLTTSSVVVTKIIIYIYMYNHVHRAMIYYSPFPTSRNGL